MSTSSEAKSKSNKVETRKTTKSDGSTNSSETRGKANKTDESMDKSTEESHKSSLIDDLIVSMDDERFWHAFNNKAQSQLVSSIDQLLDKKFEAFASLFAKSIKEDLDERIQNKSTEITNKITEPMKKDIEDMKDKTSQMQARFDALENNIFKLDLIIYGLSPNDTTSTISKPDKSYSTAVTSADNLAMKKVLEFAQTSLGMDLTEQDISSCSALKKTGVKSPDFPIFITFKTYAKRCELLKKGRHYAKMNSVNRRIFLNEHLTKSNANLFQHTRALKKDKKIYSTWSFDGYIFIKQSSTSKPVKISSMEDLNSLAI